MKYASEAKLDTSVADWKPATPERFIKLLHTYEVECCDEHGHEALTQTAFRQDHETTGVIYYIPKRGKRPDAVSSPVLLTIRFANGKVMCFESTKYGVGKLQDIDEAGPGPHHYIPDPDGDGPPEMGERRSGRRGGEVLGRAGEELVADMVHRFLSWRLPADFSPDAGISFKPDFNEHTDHPMKHEPTGTNLLTHAQAEKMVRHMFGLDDEPPGRRLPPTGQVRGVRRTTYGDRHG